MAGFLDKPVQFTPYRPENPVDAMLSVGITRQQDYQQGLQKVQSYMNSLSGFDISKKEIKDYVQGKIGELTQNINNISGDFSDQRLVNQIGGAASKIANDPIVQNGIIASQNIRNGYQQIEQSRKEGKSAAENEWYFQNSVNQWLNDGQFDTKLSASYTPYYDIQKKVREIYKDMNEGQDIPDGAVRWQTNPQTGKSEVVANEVLMQGLSLKRVKDAIDIVMQTPDASNQLQITGAYKFQGLDGKGMYDYLSKSTKANLETLNTALIAAQVKLAGADPMKKKEILAEIKTLEQQANSLKSNFEGYVQGLETNVEGLKSQIVGQELSNNLLGALAYQKFVENPLYNAFFQKEKFLWEKEKFKSEFEQKERHHKDTIDKDKEVKTLPFEVSTLPVSESEGEKGSATFQTTLDNAIGRASDLRKQTIVNFANAVSGSGLKSPYVKDPITGGWVPNIQAYGSADAAIKAAQEMELQMQSEFAKGKITNQALLDQIGSLNTAWDDVNLLSKKKEKIEKRVQPQIEKIKSLIKDEDYASAYIIQNNLPGKEFEINKFKKKYGDSWRDVVYGQSVGYGGFVPGILQSREYNSAIKNVSKKEITPLLEQRENEYRAAQTGYENKAAFFNTAKPENRGAVETKFRAALETQARLTGNQDADDMLELISGKESEKNNYFVYTSYDKNGNKIANLGIEKDGERKEVQVPYNTYLTNFAQVAVDDGVWQKYKTRLSINNGQSTYSDPTDVNYENGRVSAITSKVGENVLQYHLIEDAVNPGTYNIRLWVTEPGKNEPTINGIQYSPGNKSMTLEQADAMIDYLKKGTNLNILLQNYNK